MDQGLLRKAGLNNRQSTEAEPFKFLKFMFLHSQIFQLNLFCFILNIVRQDSREQREEDTEEFLHSGTATATDLVSYNAHFIILPVKVHWCVCPA